MSLALGRTSHLHVPKALRVGCAAAAVVGILSGATGGAAQSMTVAVHVDYRAASGCPTEAAFVSRVEGRTSHARFTSQENASLAFEVRVVGAPDFAGEVRVKDGETVRGVRRVEASSCEEVADVVAFMVALTIDPQVGLPEAHERGSPLDGGATVAGDAAASEPSVPEVDADARLPIEPVEGGLQPASDARRAPGPFALGAVVSLSSGVGPHLLVGLSPFAQWRMLRVGFLRTGSGNVSVTDGQADFTWTVGRLDVCPLQATLGSVTGSVCARGEAGTLEAQGTSAGGTAGHTRGWLAAGALARAEWRVWGPLFLEAEGGAMARFTNDRFYFLPQVTVYQVPIVGFSGGAGVGVHFP